MGYSDLVYHFGPLPAGTTQVAGRSLTGGQLAQLGRMANPPKVQKGYATAGKWAWLV